MAVSNSSSRPSATRSVDTSFSWTLSSGAAGTRHVYVWFRDGKGNWSGAASDTITLDLPPSAVGDSDSFCNNPDFFYQIAVLRNDSDPDGSKSSLRIKAITQPSGGGARTRLSSSDSDAYVIDIYDQTAGFAGTVRFSYTIVDSYGLTDTATVSITYTGPCS